MKGLLLIALGLAVSSAAHGSSPLELSIAKLDLPKLTLTVKNTDANRNMRLWSHGCSWGEQTVHFELFDNAGNAIAKYYHQSWAYTGNFPRFYELKPGEVTALDFDLSDKRTWIQPEKLDLSHLDGVRVRAVLNQHLEVEAHRSGVFTGEVRSPRTSAANADGPGSCVEWNALPPRHEGHRFDSAVFLESLGKLQIRQDNAETNLLECLESKLPWSQAAIISGPGPYWNPDHQSATLLLPDAIAVTFIWDTKESLSKAEKLQLEQCLKLPKFGDGGNAQPGWAVASDVLSKLPARGITKILVSRLFHDSSWRLLSDGHYRKE
ncbi:hypothetical protein [Prosthecobacter sp.]|uniref:hypothetical protein n=1 Tax=Prosthecobacter sp. TaxID=1965333 RepID=UPI0037834486